MHTLYDYLDSGNGYKIRLLLAQFGLTYGWVDSTSCKARPHAEFLAKNPERPHSDAAAG